MTVQDQVITAALRYGVDPALALAVARQESGFNQSARGSSGEVGVFQLMPGTASDLGVNPYDEAENIEGGVRYLSSQLSRFGSEGMALAAYNCGPSCAASGSIPASTERYVQSVLSQVPLYSSYSTPAAGSFPPEDGGFHFSFDLPSSPSSVPSAGGIGENETTLLVLAALAAAALLA